jgi:hypothetical protein
VEEQERNTLGSSTHLTPAEAGRLLGSSPARVREMIRRGELTQEQVDGRWLIPLEDINRTLNPSSEPGNPEKFAASRDQKAKRTKKKHEGKLLESTSPSPQSISKVPAMKKPRDLTGETERLDRMMKQIDADLRTLRSGLMNDEKRERIEKLKMEKSRHGKNLQELQRELSKRENDDSSKRF